MKNFIAACEEFGQLQCKEHKEGAPGMAGSWRGQDQSGRCTERPETLTNAKGVGRKGAELQRGRLHSLSLNHRQPNFVARATKFGTIVKAF